MEIVCLFVLVGLNNNCINNDANVCAFYEKAKRISFFEKYSKISDSGEKKKAVLLK